MPWKRMLLAIATILSCASCSSSPATDNDCAWLKPVILDPGYGSRLTDAEMAQIAALDKTIVKVCGHE